MVGASQYTTQVSGSTIYVSPMEALPLRNVPVIAPTLPLDDEVIDSAAVSSAIKGVLRRLDLGEGDTPVAVFVPWRGSATFARLTRFCEGAVDGLSDILARGHPLVLAGDGDVGGLLGIHLREEMKIENGVVSIDGLELKDFDFIDIGTMLPTSGAVPVVIKSLIFPTTRRDRQGLAAGAARHRRGGRGRINKSQRHARACRGHPCLSFSRQDVDGRDKPGHDGGKFGLLERRSE